MKNVRILLLGAAVCFMSCGGSTNQAVDSSPSDDPMDNKGIGPITKVSLNPEINQEMVAKGKKLYGQVCSTCHKPDVDFIGPTQKGVLDRYSPEWVMNMMMNPTEMIYKDPIAKKLLIEYNGVPMADQDLTEEQARNILEYFRTL